MGMDGSISQYSCTMVLSAQDSEPLDEIIAQMSRTLLNRQSDDFTLWERVIQCLRNVCGRSSEITVSEDRLASLDSCSISYRGRHTVSVCVVTYPVTAYGSCLRACRAHSGCSIQSPVIHTWVDTHRTHHTHPRRLVLCRVYYPVNIVCWTWASTRDLSHHMSSSMCVNLSDKTSARVYRLAISAQALRLLSA